MAPAAEDKTQVKDSTQVQFLVACIKNSNDGKVRLHFPPWSMSITLIQALQVNFQAVADECEIVSKAAA